MEAVGDHLKVMVKVFRRECHRVLHSERTTIHGADGMLMLLQLAMADVNKQVTVHSYYSNSFSSVGFGSKYFLSLEVQKVQVHLSKGYTT